MAFTEPLHEYAQFGAILQKMLKWRHMKHLQYEFAQEALEAKRDQLGEYEKVENQASRVTSALERGGRGALAAEIQGNTSQGIEGAGELGSGPGPAVNTGTWGRRSLYGEAAEETDAWVGASSASAPASAATSPRASASMDQARTSTSSEAGIRDSIGSGGPPAAASPGRRSASASRTGKRFSSNYGFLGALSHTFQAVLDVDPEATRRNNIAKLRDSIAQLEEAVALTEKDLKYATDTIQGDLDRFQSHKVADFKQMMIDFVKIHREHSREVSRGLSIPFPVLVQRLTRYLATSEPGTMEGGKGRGRPDRVSAGHAGEQSAAATAHRRECPASVIRERRRHDDVADRAVAVSGKWTIYPSCFLCMESRLVVSGDFAYKYKCASGLAAAAIQPSFRSA